MRISEHYSLSIDQSSLDFVDVDLSTDTPLFLDPTALYLLNTEWGVECRHLIRDFFGLVIQSIKSGDHNKAIDLLAELSEPNETHLGLSQKRSRGHGMGIKLATKMVDELELTGAARTGIISDLEDTALMIDGIASDVISDIVTNIIREPLLRYTEVMCKAYGIELIPNVASKILWDSANKRWYNKSVSQPVVDEEQLMLVPKVLVRKSITYDAGNYYNMYILERLQDENMAKGIVRILTDKSTRPLTKKSLIEQHGFGKEQNRRLTKDRTELLSKYRDDKQKNPKESLTETEIADATETPPPEWDRLYTELKAVPTGKPDALEYEKVTRRLFDALFYPSLSFPDPQTRINEGRKIIDITYYNSAQKDFFKWVHDKYGAPYVIVECKNYSEDPKNPEIDQLAMRLNKSRGVFGILACRSVSDKRELLARMKDVMHDAERYLIVIDDDDIKTLIDAAKMDDQDERFSLLRAKFNELVM